APAGAPSRDRSRQAEEALDGGQRDADGLDEVLVAEDLTPRRRLDAARGAAGGDDHGGADVGEPRPAVDVGQVDPGGRAVDGDDEAGVRARRGALAVQDR